MTGRRHLTIAEATSALRRGSQIDQYLGRFIAEDGRPTVRWLAAFRHGRSFTLVLHEVEDVGNEDYLDLSTFPPLNADEEVGEGRELSTANDASDLLQVATAEGADPERWVNFGVAQDEYRETGRARSRR